jgi:hypothetical protein
MTGVSEEHLLGRPLLECVACGSKRLEPVVEVDTEEVHFLCQDCMRCWHVELGYVHRVAPHACHGCPHRRHCEPVYFADQLST